MKEKIRLYIIGLICGLIVETVTTQAAFQLVENFQAIPVGPLNGQQGWSATLAQVKADPQSISNKVASFEGPDAGGANLPLSIPDGTTATLFFRAYSEADTTLVDWFAGMSDVAVEGIGNYPDFEAQIGYAGSQIFDTLRVRDGSAGGNEPAGEFLPRTWYKIWAVIDNAADTYEVYIKGGSATNQTPVASSNSGSTSFVFRNSAGGPEANDLIRFLVKSGADVTPGPALLDDIYLAPGKDLSDPVPNVNSPPTVTIVEPGNAATFTAPASITLRANATDTDGTIGKVDFFQGTTLLGSATNSPFNLTWTNVAPGFYTLTAKATDNLGGSQVSRGISITVNPTGTNNFILLDHFENESLGALNGQNGWTAASATVIVDPTQSNNKVASFDGAGGATLTAFLPEGKTGTLFLRAYSASDTTDVDWCAGLSDVTAAGPARDHSDFEAQICVAGAETSDSLRVRDGAAGENVDVEEFKPRTWYKIWIVINNALDQFEVYMQGGQLATPTRLVWDTFGYDTFVFRNSGVDIATNDLVKFLVLTTTAHIGQFLLDDIYLDQFGKNLNDPVGAANVLPTVAITAPSAGSTFTTPTNITITADASRTGGTISNVDFYAGTNLIGSDTASPYSITWSNVTAGAYTLTAKATDNQGGSQVSAPVSITVAQGASLGFQLVEDFQSIPVGTLNGQRGWSATLAQVKVDPAQAANKVASFEGAGAGGANLPLLIAQGTTATLFFRAYSEGDTTLADWFAGMSDLAVSGVGAFGDFEIQIGYSGSQILDTLRVRDGGTGANEAAGEFLPRTWYRIWAVIDNAADTYQVYIQGGSFTQQTQVAATATSNTSFAFRNSGAGPVTNNLIRFFVKSGTDVLPGPALLDDIYLATGEVLTDPTSGAVTQLHILEIKPDFGSGDITLRWEGEGPQFQVEKAGTITGPFQPLGAAQSAKVFTEAGVLKTSARSFYRVRRLP